jgi:hypothetical protein
MKAKEIIVAGATGTTFMTLFSYIASAIDLENYSEPERLGQLTHRLMPVLNKRQSYVVGWAGHYIVGLAFAAAYVKLWNEGKIKPSFKNNLLLGGVSGLLALVIWKTTFKMHPLPPRLSFNKYYLQLIPAHLVFAVFSGLGYVLLKKAIAKREFANKYKGIRRL